MKRACEKSRRAAAVRERMVRAGAAGRWVAVAAAGAAGMVASSASLAQTIINSGNRPPEPPNHHSFIVAHGGNDIRDDELATMVFGGPLENGWTTALFTFGQCFSGGFINDLGYLNPRQPRDNVGVAAAAWWRECSFSDPSDPYTANTFLSPWHLAVDDPHPDDDTFLDAFNMALLSDPNVPTTGPQYFGNGNADGATLGRLGDSQFAVLFVGDTDTRPDFFVDIDRIHTILTGEYGYDDDDIFAYYGDGLRQDEGDPFSPALPGWIDGSGTKANLTAGLNSIGQVFTVDDGLFFWVSNHGLPTPGAGVLFVIGGAGLLGRRSRRE